MRAILGPRDACQVDAAAQLYKKYAPHTGESAHVLLLNRTHGKEIVSGE